MGNDIVSTPRERLGKFIIRELHRKEITSTSYVKIIEQGKTVSAAARYLYVFNFGTTNSKIGFFHKNMEGAKDNLQRRLRDEIPCCFGGTDRKKPHGSYFPWGLQLCLVLHFLLGLIPLNEPMKEETT